MTRHRCPHCGRFCKPAFAKDPTCGWCLPPLEADEQAAKPQAAPFTAEQSRSLNRSMSALDAFFFGGSK